MGDPKQYKNDLDYGLSEACRSETEHITYGYNYSITIKPLKTLDNNEKSVNKFYDKFIVAMHKLKEYDPTKSLFNVFQKVYEVDSKGKLHMHLTLESNFKIRDYYSLQQKGCPVFIKELKSPVDVKKWCNYLCKCDQGNVLMEHKLQNEYAFQN